MTRFYSNLIISTFIFVVYVKLFNQKSPEFSFGKKSKEFRVELKDVNISYFYYGFGEFKCGEESNILISTLSRPNAFGTRMKIRTSWKRDIPSTMTHKFFIGTVENERIKKALKKESQKFGDIVFTSLIDSYSNLTLKMNSLYQFQQNYCPKIDFFLRADEDTVLDVSRFEYWLNKEFNKISKQLDEMVIFGYLYHNNNVIRDSNSKWYVSYKTYPYFYYPDYVQGPCYLATSKAIKLILEESKNHLHITVDDAFYTGIIRNATEIEVFNGSKYFALTNPLNELNPSNKWDHECDENGIPRLFSIVDQEGEIKNMNNGYAIWLNKLKGLQASC